MNDNLFCPSVRALGPRIQMKQALFARGRHESYAMPKQISTRLDISIEKQFKLHNKKFFFFKWIITDHFANDPSA